MNKTDEIANKIVEQFKDYFYIEASTPNNSNTVLSVKLRTYANEELMAIKMIVGMIEEAGFYAKVLTEFNPIELGRWCRIEIYEKRSRSL